jgi:hypothetical protein
MILLLRPPAALGLTAPATKALAPMARFQMAPFPTALVALAPTDLVAPAPMVMAPAVLSGSHRSLSDGSDGYGYIIYAYCGITVH